MKQRRQGHRYKEKKRKKPDKSKPKKYFSHHLYGDIPLIPVKFINRKGNEDTYWDYDPDYKPSLPAKAVAGNVNCQVFWHGCHVPKYFYINEERHCIQCGKKFVFSAKEQKYWYETLKFNTQSTAVRCAYCRKKKRSDGAINTQLSDAMKKLKENPCDPLILLAVVEATLRNFDRFGTGKLDRAIAMCRKALSNSPNLYECLYWEGLCQEKAGRPGKATEIFSQFINLTKDHKRYHSFLKRAETRI